MVEEKFTQPASMQHQKIVKKPVKSRGREKTGHGGKCVCLRIQVRGQR
jgi:hypothetical protein